jgi:hypothetical protein
MLCQLDDDGSPQGAPAVLRFYAQDRAGRLLAARQHEAALVCGLAQASQELAVAGGPAASRGPCEVGRG